MNIETSLMDKQYLYTCKSCGSHDVVVASLYTIYEEHQKILPCECHKSSTGIAAIQSFLVEKQYEDYGYLDERHYWQFAHKNNLIDRKEIDTDFDLQCSKCYIIYEIDKRRWEIKIEQKELSEESVEFQVSCGGCGLELEFGWSQPDRAGQIWPVECIDFDPEKVWPEPRFREKWSHKGWTRSDLLFESFVSETKIRTILRKMGLLRAC